MLPVLPPPARLRRTLCGLALSVLLLLPLSLSGCSRSGQPPHGVLLQALSLQIQLTQGAIAEALQLESDGLPQVSRVRVEQQQAIRIGEARGLRLAGRFDWRLSGDPIRVDSAFEAVMEGCAAAPRRGQPGTWISADFIRAYTDLHRRGYAHSFEAWRQGALVGGLYGVSLGAAFFGMRLTASSLIAALITYLGLAVVFVSDFSLGGPNVTLGTLLVLGAAVSFVKPGPPLLSFSPLTRKAEDQFLSMA